MKLKIITSIILLIWITLFSYSLFLPKYTNEKAFEKLLDNVYSEYPTPKIEKYNYYETELKFRTNKLVFMDLWVWLISFSITLFIFLFYQKIYTLWDFKKITSLKKISLLLLTYLSWLLSIPWLIWFYLFRFYRWDYPPFSDTIIIPIYIWIQNYILLFIIFNIILFIWLYKSNLPTEIFIKSERSWRNFFWEIFFWIIILICLSCLFYLIIDWDIVTIPINMFLIYIILTLRAGKTNKPMQDEIINLT